MRRGLLICGLLALAVTPAAHGANVEVVVTLKSPPLAEVFARHGTLAFSSFARPNRLLLNAPASRDYLQRLETAQRSLQARIQTRIPRARVRWRFGVVLNGFAVVVPRSDLAKLSRVAGVEVWPSVGYHTLLDMTPQIIGAPTVWGPTLATAGQGVKIAIVDDGIDQTHPFFAPTDYTYPAGFPKGQTAYTTPKVIAARAFAPATPVYANAKLPFDPELSDHGIHVAGIAAGNNNTPTRSGPFRLSGIAPHAYLGNYKALGIPSEFGANGNSPELAAAVEAAVRDGMDVINMSLGEAEIDPSRDLVARALNAAADAGVVSAISAGNDFGELGFGSITSPGNAAKVISVAASSGGHGSPDVDNIADFSSAGPTPYSLTFKPDVTAPGQSVASAAPGGGFVESSGTSMSAPHVAGAAALFRQRHPTWTPSQIKSALVLTGDPVRNGGTAEVNPLREGGGRINLVRADQPLVFASPTNVSFGLLKPGATVQRTVSLADAGGGAGLWNVATSIAGAPLSLPAQATVPGLLPVRAVVPRNAREGEVTGFVVVSRDGARRRIPFWLRVERPRLRRDRHVALVRPGEYAANTSRGAARVSSYRYPDVLPGHAAFPVSLTGREIVYRVHIRRRIANFGVAVITRNRGVQVEPRVVRGGDENRLAGYTGLPFDQNPYRSGYGRHRLVAGVALPGPDVYDIVFDTPRGARSGAFRFRFWQGDIQPPSVRVLGVRNGFLELAVSDGGSGVDPLSLQARIDGDFVPVSFASGRARVSLAGDARGRHTLSFTASDYQEAKNMENVARILPNTRTLRTTFVRP
ncbi:MAG: S8 family serine peptidase [Actinomycetota bacterium]|nr:S8 family serine peptidase [Actinomycetota bacterium]